VIKFLLILFFQQPFVAALEKPAGSTLPTTPANIKAAAALTEVFQYGPGMWSSPGLHAMTEWGVLFPFELTMLPNPVPIISAPDFKNYTGGISEEISIGFVTGALTGALPIPPRPSSIGIGSYAANLLQPFSFFAIQNPSGQPLDLANVTSQILGAARFGSFNSGIYSDNANASVLWAFDYVSKHKQLNDAGMGIHGRSRGLHLVEQLRVILLNADALYVKESKIRNLLYRHNHQVASYRAIGLNPMWLIGNPTVAKVGPDHDSDLGYAHVHADYVLNLQSRFFYRDAARHTKAAAADLPINTLGLLYRTFAVSLAFESGHATSRVGLLDPAFKCDNRSEPITADLNDRVNCRIEEGTIPLAGIRNAQFDFINSMATHGVHFGTPSDYLVIYEVLKFLFPAPGAALAAARAIVNTGDLAALQAQVAATTGVAYPTNLATTVQLARALFESAYKDWSDLLALNQTAPLFAPRPSAAFIVAAAMVGKRIDPVFWGHLAEAEQALLKNDFAGYKGWVDSLWATPATTFSAAVTNDFGLALWDLAEFRAVAASPDAYLNNLDIPAAYAGTGIVRLLRSAYNPLQRNFALVRGPVGLTGLNGEFKLASHFRNNSGRIKSKPGPNAFLEVAETGHPIIDGRLMFLTNGTVVAFDINNETKLQPPNNDKSVPFLPFEFDAGGLPSVVGFYVREAAQALGVPPASLVTKVRDLAFAVPAAIGNPSKTTAAEAAYRDTTGKFKTLMHSFSDGRFLQPALQYWLVTNEKLNSNGINNAMEFPGAPQLIPAYNLKMRKNYRLINLTGVTMTDSRPAPAVIPDTKIPRALSNAQPSDAYEHYLGDNSWGVGTALVVRRSIATPFVSGVNDYLKRAPGLPIALPVAVDVAVYTVNPAAAPAPSGAGSVCVEGRRAIFRNHDESVPCP